MPKAKENQVKAVNQSRMEENIRQMEEESVIASQNPIDPRAQLANWQLRFRQADDSVASEDEF